MENHRINPFKVMTDPRGFIHDAFPRTRKASAVLAWLLGMTYLFGKAYTFGLGTIYDLGPILVFCIAFALPVGYIMLYINSFFLYWVGKLFNGVATFEEVFSAYTWTRVPEAFILLIWLGLVGLFGKEAFSALAVTEHPMSLVVLAMIIAQVGLAAWQAVILFHALGEVQRLSAWVTVWSVLFA